MTIQQIRSSKKSGHYVTYIFSDFGSTVTLINDTKIQSYEFSTFSKDTSSSDGKPVLPKILR